MMSKPVFVRDLRREDLPAIVSIEERVTGVARPEYWTARIEISEAIRPHWASLVAEMDSRVVGFILGRAGELEFGLPGTIGWIEIIGVDPAYRGQGIGRALIGKFVDSAQDHGIRSVFTLVDQGNREIEGFFSSLGFVQGKMVHFQKDISSGDFRLSGEPAPVVA